MKDLKEFYYRHLLNSISQKIYTGFDLELIGILEDFDLYDNKKSFSFLEYIIECKIFLEQKEIPRHFHCIDIMEVMECENLSFHHLDAFIYNEKKYIFNFKIYSEIFKITEYVIKTRMRVPLENDILYIISELKGILDNDNKIKFLEKKIKLYWKPFEDSRSFLIFMNERKEWEGQTWEDEIRSFLVEDDFFTLFYLTCSIDENLEQKQYYKTTFKLWVEHYRKQKIINFCIAEIERIEELKNPNDNSINKSSNNSLADLIFKKDGEEIFNFIVSKYPKTKSVAFFSYLFFFIKNIDKSHIEGDDSLDYRKYIIEEFKIPSFARIINSVSDKQRTKEKINILFDKYLLEYNLLKMNEK